jgi:2-oxoisovalerate dehydrogenase E2 component (dihydrolipoyl transacylase)
MTDKAAVEVPAPVGGKVLSITGAPGDKVAVGSPLIVFELGDSAAEPETSPVSSVAMAPRPSIAAPPSASTPSHAAETAMSARHQGRVIASPANRRRAREAGIDLRTALSAETSSRLRRCGPRRSRRLCRRLAIRQPRTGPIRQPRPLKSK